MKTIQILTIDRHRSHILVENYPAPYKNSLASHYTCAKQHEHEAATTETRSVRIYDYMQKHDIKLPVLLYFTVRRITKKEHVPHFISTSLYIIWSSLQKAQLCFYSNFQTSSVPEYINRIFGF